MKILKAIFIMMALLLIGCAQIPKESVELSATVGRDLSEMKKSHIALVDLYYKELQNDINRFIDNVYLPHQIQKSLSDDILKKEMLGAIETASKVDPIGKAQKEAFAKIEIFLLMIHEDVESYRKLKLKPIQDQYSSVLSNINKGYDQIHYANSIVTGHLASIVKVHNAQNELLEKIHLKDLRSDAGGEFADMSEKIANLLQKAKKGEDGFDSIVNKFENLIKSKK